MRGVITAETAGAGRETLFRAMPAQLVTEPNPFALTKGGRMVYQYFGSDRIISAGSKAICVLLFSAAVADGRTLTLKWKGIAHQITFKTSPVESNEFPIGDGSAAYVDSLLLLFKSYFPFYQDFILTRNAADQLPGIIFTAKEAGAAYNIQDPAFPVGTPFGFGRTTDGADAKIRPRYGIYAELWLQKPGTTGADEADYVLKFKPSGDVNENGLALFDAGDILHSELAADLPSWNLAQPQRAITSHLKYFVRYAEAWGTPLRIGRISQDVTRDAYLGGADYVNRAGIGFSLDGFVQKESPDKDQALRFGSKTRYVRFDEPQYISFLNTRSTVPAKVRITLRYDNGTSQTYSDILDAFTFARSDKWTLPAGVTQLKLLDKVPAGRQLVEYELRLTTAGLEAGQTAHLSAPYRYILNGNYEPYTRYFAYVSSLGVIETMATFGKGSTELTRFFEQANRFTPAFYDVPYGQFIDYDVSIQEQIEVSTGFRKKIDLQHQNDFYRSAQRFHLIDGKALPISIVSKSIKTTRDGDTTFAHKFQFVYLFRNDFYTYVGTDEDDDDSPPPNFRPMGDVTVVQNQVINSVDPTIDDALRTVDAAELNDIRVATARPAATSYGFLNEQNGRLVFRPLDKKLDYVSDLTNKPSTRNDAGLTDVPTRDETEDMINQLGGVQASITSWITPNEPLV
jgi:hypothetical protein